MKVMELGCVLFFSLLSLQIPFLNDSSAFEFDVEYYSS